MNACPVREVPLACPECGAPMELWRSRSGSRYRCSNQPACRGSHRAHPHGEPTGILADSETRSARARAHEVFDLLWKSAELLYEGEPNLNGGRPKVAHLRQIARGRAYLWLADRLGIATADCHFGRMDSATCFRALALMDGLSASDVRAWAKAKGERR